MPRTRERFETETDPTGRPWLITARKKRYGGKILTKTGRLKGSFRRRVNTTAGTVEIASGLRYAYIQHFGAKDLATGIIRIPRGASAEQKKALKKRRAINKNIRAKRGPVVLPARPILGVSSGDEQAILGIIRRRALRLWR